MKKVDIEFNMGMYDIVASGLITEELDVYKSDIRIKNLSKLPYPDRETSDIIEEEVNVRLIDRALEIDF